VVYNWQEQEVRNIMNPRICARERVRNKIYSSMMRKQ
jgi:hypothetical protein